MESNHPNFHENILKTIFSLRENDHSIDLSNHSCHYRYQFNEPLSISNEQKKEEESKLEIKYDDGMVFNKIGHSE